MSQADEKVKALELAVAQIEKQFGKGAIMKMSEATKVTVDVIPTGSLGLDIALGVGGVPRGRIIEVYGPESSGKTTLAYHMVAETQKKGGVAAFIDAEHAMDPEYAGNIGVDLEKLLISQPDTGEQALEIVETLVRSNAVDIVVVDSVAALVPRAEIEGEMGDSHMGLQARLMSATLRRLASIVSQTKTLVIFLNQTRMKIGVMWGSPITTPGGLALKFYSSVRVELKRIAQIKQGEEITGSRIRAKIVKNKVAAPFKTAEFDIFYNEGISYIADLLNTALKLELIKKAGSWLQYEDTKLGQGMEGSKKFLKENPLVLKKLKEAVLNAEPA